MSSQGVGKQLDFLEGFTIFSEIIMIAQDYTG